MYNCFQYSRFHFIGVAGIGMSALAEMLLNQGFLVSGSDKNRNLNVEKLEKKGLRFFQGHHEQNVNYAEVVVISSAISNSNVELLEAQKKGLLILKRGQLLAHLMLLKKGIAVSGTHGKTTTSSILATIMVEANTDPTVLVGGNVVTLDGNSRTGKGDFFISEVDESDGSFLLLNPIACVVTNIDDDHVDYYGSFEKLKSSFVDFMNKIPFYGICSLNVEDHHLMSLKSNLRVPTCTFGIDIVADYNASNIQYDIHGTQYDLKYKNEVVCKIHLNVPGRHNVLNSLAAISLAHNLGLEFQEIAYGVSKYLGVGRRLEKIGEFKKINFLDDYAHHPTEIKVTLSTLKNIQDKKVIAIFEPHRYTRTKSCWRDFIHCFDDVDKLFILPIYAASEPPIEGINTTELVGQIQNLTDVDVEEIDSYQEIFTIINRYADEDVILISLGAGPISTKMRETIRLIKQ